MGETETYSPAFKAYKDMYMRGLFYELAIGLVAAGDQPIQLRERGEDSGVYVDSAKAFSRYQECFEGVVYGLAAIIKKVAGGKPILLVNVDSKASGQLTGAVSLMLGVPQVFYLNEDVKDREKGMQTQIRMPKRKNIAPDTQAFFIDDVITHGDTQMNVVEQMRDVLPPSVEYHLVAGLFRGSQEDKEALAQQGISVDTITTLEELFSYF